MFVRVSESAPKCVSWFPRERVGACSRVSTASHSERVEAKQSRNFVGNVDRLKAECDQSWTGLQRGLDWFLWGNLTGFQGALAELLEEI